ncbi:bromodomain adjacent to zinc finger domain protein 2B isoform 2-T5 [Menidia menidia]
MESGQRLASPLPAPPSVHVTSSSNSSSSTPPQTPFIQFSPAPSPEDSSPLTCGRLMQTNGDEHSDMPISPAFGLYSSSSGPSKFGGLGSLGLSTLATHSQFGRFPDWWRPTDTHTTGTPAFFPPLLGLHPCFLSTFKSLDSVNLQSQTSGLNGTVNGRNASSPSLKSAKNTSSFPAKQNKTEQKTVKGQSQKKICAPVELLKQTINKTKKKIPAKSPPEASNISSCLSGSLSETSSDGEESSGDPDDTEEEDKGDQSSDSEDSGSEEDSPLKRKAIRLTHNTSESKKRRTSASDGITTHSVPVTSSSHLNYYSHPASRPKSTALLLQSSRNTGEKGQQHISVIQATGQAVSNGSLAQSQSGACPLPFKSAPKSTSLPCSSEHSLNSPKQNSACSSPQYFALFSPKKSLSLCYSPKHTSLGSPNPLSLLSAPQQARPLTSKESSYRPQFTVSSGKHAPATDGLKEKTGNYPDEGSSHLNTVKLKLPVHSKDSVKQASSARLKGQNCDINLFLNLSPDGAGFGTVQDAPLALITKPRSHICTTKPLSAATSPDYHMPINLSTGAKEMSHSSTSTLKPSALSGPTPRARTAAGTLTGVSCLTTDLTKQSESDFYCSKGSDSSEENDDDDEGDDFEDEDSGSSLSGSESNLESDSNGSECVEMEADCDADRTPLKPAEASGSTHKPSLNHSANCSLLNLQITRPPSLPSSGLLNPINTVALRNHSNNSSPFRFATIAGSGKKRRVTDERVLQLPLDFGWRRETRIRTVAGRVQGEVAYIAPCGKKLRQYPDVIKYLVRNGISEISRDNFSFSTKMKVGDFYEAREGPEGSQWFLLAKDEISPSIIAMDGRRSRRMKLEHQPTGDGSRHPHPENNSHDVSNAKLLRKLEAQEIARQAAEIKLVRKLEKQAIAKAAKEARKQQAIIAAEERRKKREEVKIFKQQEKIRRIQQIRLEKEVRAQQILEAKRKKKEAAANAKILEAEKRNKEKEMRRLQAVIQKHQERERRRQHMMLMKAVEARKKAEEKERLKKEKKDEKRLNKQRKLEIRRLELEKAKELNKPNEDMCLADHQPLPEFPRIPGLVLPGNTFSDCLMVMQFLHSFGKVLKLDLNSDMLTLGKLQEGLLNVGDGMQKVQDLLVSMLSAAVCDPGTPAGNKIKNILGDHLTNVEINRDNVSEILQIYMESHSEQTEVAVLAFSLKTKAFQAHSPSQKASMLAFLVNELCCSKAVISEIDKNIDCMTNLRKDKWMVEGKLRKLRNIHAKTTGKKDSSPGGEDSHAFCTRTVRNKCKRKERDSDEEEEDEDDSEDQADDDDDEEDEESGGKKGKKAEMCEEEDDGSNPASIEELEKQIEKTYKQQSQIRQKMFDSSHSLRSMMIGEDRYKRRYWALPQCGGIFVEGCGEGSETLQKEDEGHGATHPVRVKEEQQEETSRPVDSISMHSIVTEKNKTECQQVKDNLFLQKPSSLPKLSKLLEKAKMAQNSDSNPQNTPSAEIPVTAHHPSYLTSQMDKTDTSVPSLLTANQLKHSHWVTCSPQSILNYDQLSKILTEKSNEWFSLLPRSPCDGSSVTSGSSPSASSSSPPSISNKLPSFLSPISPSPASCNTTVAIDNLQLSIPQQVKSGIHQSRLTPSDMFSLTTCPDLSLSGTSIPTQHAEDNGNKAFFLTDNCFNTSETSEPQSGKPSCASFSSTVAVKTQDYPCPKPIPEEMLHGWWCVSGVENLHTLIKTLHSRGIREKALQKQLQKQLEHITQLFPNSNNESDTIPVQKQGVSMETVENWCVEQWAVKVDISLLRQVEDLEKKVISAGLQVKGWVPDKPQSDSKDLAYHEHKLYSSPALENKGLKEIRQEDFLGSIVRWPNNPLDIAVTRLAELERNIEQREDDVGPGMRMWRKALSQVCSSAQLSLCIQQLEKSLAWERAIMKVHCQLCQRGDNEELLLLCDGCDKGCHTYCHNPKITTIPDGDWFCSLCVAKERGTTPQSMKQQSRTAGGGKKCGEVKRNCTPSVGGEFIIKEDASRDNVPKRGTKECKKKKGDDSSQAKSDSSVACARKAKTAKDNCNWLGMCQLLLAELEAHQDAWPFLTPVNHKAVPGYRKVIKKPMDFSTIREKLTNNLYLNLETFIIEVNLVFDNCERFNEDNSEIGRAGHNMRRFFEKRWTELLK